MNNRTYDRYLAHENYVHEVACVECGFHRNGKHHSKIKCPHTGRCGECGSDWPCEEHVLLVPIKIPSSVTLVFSAWLKRQSLKHRRWSSDQNLSKRDRSAHNDMSDVLMWAAEEVKSESWGAD